MSADIELIWEWPADRTIEQKLLVKILDVKTANSGFFGFKKTPSFASNFPDPVTVNAQLVGQDTALRDKTIELTLPKLELESIKQNDLAVIGIVESKICICIKRVESESVDVTDISCP